MKKTAILQYKGELQFFYLTQLCPFYLVSASVSAVLQWRFALLCTTDFIYSDFLYGIFLYFSCS